jgi:hypothetical protein
VKSQERQNHGAGCLHLEEQRPDRNSGGKSIIHTKPTTELQTVAARNPSAPKKTQELGRRRDARKIGNAALGKRRPRPAAAPRLGAGRRACGRRRGRRKGNTAWRRACGRGKSGQAARRREQSGLNKNPTRTATAQGSAFREKTRDCRTLAPEKKIRTGPGPSAREEDQNVNQQEWKFSKKENRASNSDQPFGPRSKP